MAPKGIKMGLILGLVVMLWGGSNAQSGCTQVLMGLSPCLNYVTGNSSTPSSSCCSQLSRVVQSQPKCLCSLLNGGSASVDEYKSNSGYKLTVANGPPTSANSPTSPPTDSSDQTPNNSPTMTSVPSVPSGTASKNVPGTSGSTSDGSIVKLPLYFMVFALLIATSASIVFSFLAFYNSMEI